MKHGFSLIELLVTIVILGILFSITVSSFSRAIARNRFEAEKSFITDAFLDTRNMVLSDIECEDDIQFFLQRDVDDYNVSFGCNQPLILKDSRIIVPDPENHLQVLNSLKISYETNPFFMSLENGSGTRTFSDAYFLIESTNLEEPEISTVCLNRVKGFLEIYSSHCDCGDMIPDSTIPNCSF